MRGLQMVFVALAVTGCMAAPGGSVQTIAGRQLSVERNADYFWPESTVGTDAQGRIVTIDVAPIVTALLVSARSGPPLTEGDEAAARAAMQAHCAGRGLTPPDGSYRRFDGAAWAFPDCRAG